ncbi:MAG TPA: hypothetical protein PLI06_09995 [Methanofastidiosum sp.]|nr:hypothetical protein [Methanofastidiosum sp.]
MSFLAKINPYGTVISGLKNRVALLEKELSIVGQDDNLYLKETSEPKFPTISKEKILKYCDHSPLVQPIHNAIIREVTNAGWSIKPLFNSKCSKCGKEYDRPEDVSCDCGGKILRPELEQKNKLQSFIDNPHPDIDLYSIIRSALKWELCIDDYYLSLSYIRQNDRGKYFIMEAPQALYVENPLLIGKVRRGDSDWSYFCPICNLLDEEYLSESKGKCPKHKIELWETAYVLYAGRRIRRRYSKREIIEGHFNRRLPDEYGTPIIQACINQIEAALNLDLLNRDTFEKGTLAKIFAFEGYTQDEVASLEQAIASMAEKRKSIGSKLFNLFLGNSKGKIEIHDVLSDPSKLQALEWHRYYRDMLLSNYGVSPVFAGTVESGKAGNNPMLQIDVMANTTKAWMRTISEPINTVLLSALGITDWYFDFDEIEREDKKESALVQKLRAETVAIYRSSGLEMKFSRNESPEEAAMLLAYAYGWRDGKPLPMSSFKARPKIRPDCISLDCLLSKINDEGRIVFLNATVNRVSNVREEEGAIRLRTTGIEITDGKDKIWVNCHDTKPFTSKKSGKLIPGRFLSTKAQLKRTDLIGSLVSFYNIEARISKNGELSLNTGPYSNFSYEKNEQNEKSPLGEAS